MEREELQRELDNLTEEKETLNLEDKVFQKRKELRQMKVKRFFRMFSK